MLIRYIPLILLVLAATVETTARGSDHSRKLQTPSPIRILVDFSAMDYKYRNNPFIAGYIACKKTTIKAVDLLSKLIKVKRPKTSQQTPELTYGNLKIPARTFEADLYINCRVFNSQSSQKPKGIPLAFDVDTGRPIAGVLEFDINHIYLANFTHLQNIVVPLKGLYQILVFHDVLFDRFVDSDNKLVGRDNLITTAILQGKARTGYRGPSVLAKAKAHLNDPSLKYVLFEDTNDVLAQNSNWDYMYFPDDFMSSQQFKFQQISDITLSMALDSGWYEVDMDKSQLLTFGKAAGANFQTGACPPLNTAKGFCVSSKKDYIYFSPDLYGKSFCQQARDNGCYQLILYKSCLFDDPSYQPTWYDYKPEYFGPDSRIVYYWWKDASNNWKVLPNCAKISCDAQGTITYTFKPSITCVCDSSSVGYDVSCTGTTASIDISCPATAEIATYLCDSLKPNFKCPDDCSGNGICMGLASGKPFCHCRYGYTGDSCAAVNNEETDTPLKPLLKQSKSRSSSDSQTAALLSSMLVCLLVLSTI